MTVERISGPRGVAPDRRTRRTGGKTSFADTLRDAAAAGDSQPPAPVQAVGAALSVQEAGNATDREAQRRAVRHGGDLLDELDSIRLDLLTGGIPRQRLESLSRRLAEARERVNDPQLDGVLDQIELRVRVELAKYLGGT